MKRSIGGILLATWFIVTGLQSLIHFSFSGMSTVMAVLALLVGVLIALGL